MQPVWIEHGRVRIQDRSHLVADADRQRHLGENQRFVRPGRVEEGVATAVRFQAAAHFPPVVDGMDGLVSHQLLENRRRRVPVDLLKPEQRPVEDGSHHVREIVLDYSPGRMVAKPLEQVFPHANQERGSSP